MAMAIIAANIGCDQTTKFYARVFLKDRGTYQVLGDFFILRYAENNGAFLGLFSPLPKSVRIVLLVLAPSFVMMILAFYVFRTGNIPVLQIVSLCCIIGGGISNISDRIFNNENVVDFMNVGIGSIRSGVLNFADLSIVIGLAGICFMYYNRNNKIASKM